MPTDEVTFINKFTLTCEPAEFEEAFARTAAFMAEQPGFLRHTLLRNKKDDRNYVNVAHWRDAASLRNAVARPEFGPHAAALRALCTSEPNLFEPRMTT